MSSLQGSFNRSIAVVVAVNKYENGIRPLRTPRNDAEAIGKLLAESHDFETELLLDEEATKDGLIRLLQSLSKRVGPDDRVLFYFAGHGIAIDNDAGPEGYILPQNATRRSVDSLFPMTDLDKALSQLPCRHLLAVLDCCFAGALRWSSTRDLVVAARPLTKERYAWLVRDRAWQAIASAAHDQKAVDLVGGRPIGNRIDDKVHSPFADAFIRALQGSADLAAPGSAPDGVITATKLFIFLQDQLLPPPLRQGPVLWPLKKHRRGEFVFLAPGKQLELASAPILSSDMNPWRGLKPYEAKQADLFFGRSSVARDLTSRVIGRHDQSQAAKEPGGQLTVVLGPSGIGKSSLVKAGLLPNVPNETTILMVRPGTAPLLDLESALRSLGNTEPLDLGSTDQALGDAVVRSGKRRLLLVIDQAEELFTQARDGTAAMQFCALVAAALDRMDVQFDVVLTVRSEFEPQFSRTALAQRWPVSRFVIPAMTHTELREVILGPAGVRVVRFESDALVNQLADEVVDTPAALPLLSFALREMFANYLARNGSDRTIGNEDYDALEGGVVGSLRIRANHIVDAEGAQHLRLARRLLERFVSVEAGEFARRRVARSEFDVDDVDTAKISTHLLETLVDQRLVVTDADVSTADRPSPDASEGRLELAHDALIFGWDRLGQWVRSDARAISELRDLTRSAEEWAERPADASLWTDRLRRDRARRLRENFGDSLSNRETRFLKASERRARLQLTIRGVFATVACVVLFAGLQFFLQATQRQQTLSLLAAAQEVESTIDTPRQYGALLSAVEAARLSQSQFGQIIPEVRSPLLKSLVAMREVWRMSHRGPQITSVIPRPGSSEILLMYRRDPDDVGSEASIGAVVDLDTGLERTIKGDPRAEEDLAACSNAACIAYVSGGENVLLDRNGKVIWRQPVSQAPLGLVNFDEKTRTIYYFKAPAALVRVDLQSGASREQQLSTTGTPWGLLLAPDGRTMVMMFENSASLIDLGDGTSKTVPLSIGAGMPYAVSFADRYVMYGTTDSIETTSFDSGAVRVLRRLEGTSPDAIAIAPDGRTFAFEQAGSTRINISGVDGNANFDGRLHGGFGSRLVFSTDGRFLIEAGWLDRQIKKFDLTDNPLNATFVDLGVGTASLARCPGGDRIVAGGFNGRVVAVDLKSFSQTSIGSVDSVAVDIVACSPSRIVALSGGLLGYWNADGSAHSIGEMDRRYTAVAVLPDDSGVLAAAGKDLWILPWTGPSKLLCTVEEPVIREAIDPASGVVAVGSLGEGHLQVLSSSCKPISPSVVAHGGMVFGLAFTDWDQWIASAGTIGDGTLQTVSLWTRDGRQVASRDAHSTVATSVSFDEAGSMLITGGSDGTVRAWNRELVQFGPDLLHLESGIPVLVSDGAKPHEIVAAAGNRLAVLDMSDEALLGLACTRLRLRDSWNAEQADGTNARLSQACPRSPARP